MDAQGKTADIEVKAFDGSLLVQLQLTTPIEFVKGQLEKDKSAVKFAQDLKSEKIFEKLFKNPLTNSLASAIIDTES